MCDDGYADVNLSLCSACHYSCPTCSGINNSNCLSCVGASDFRINSPSSGYCNCMDRYYDNGDKKCESCHYSCFNCNNSIKIKLQSIRK